MICIWLCLVEQFTVNAKLLETLADKLVYFWVLQLFLLNRFRDLGLEISRVTRNKGLEQQSQSISRVVRLLLKVLVLFVETPHEEGSLVFDRKEFLKVHYKVAVLVDDRVLEEVLVRLLGVLGEHLNVVWVDFGRIDLL